MKIAIVGAGLAGLASAYYLLKADKSYQVTIFNDDTQKSASSVAAGLCHPFSSDGSRHVYKAFDALNLSYELLNEVETQSSKTLFLKNGLYKIAFSNKEKRLLSSIPRKHENTSWNRSVNFLNGQSALHVENGRTVFLDEYLEELLQFCIAKGAKYISKRAQDEGLKSFDKVIYCVGAGIARFKEAEPLNLQYLKGQTLFVKCDEDFAQSLISKGYIAKTQQKQHYYLGSTYERKFESSKPDEDEAKKIILPKLEQLLDLKKLKVIKCLSGVRVCNPTNHLPIIYRASEKNYFITALGSRGILYHALLGNMLANALSNDLDSSIDSRFYKKNEKLPRG